MQLTTEMAEMAAGLSEASGVEILTAAAEIAPYIHDWRRRFAVNPAPVAFPRSTQEVASLVGHCAERGISIIPQGGNTGMSGGTVVPPERAVILLNTSRLNRIHEIDTANQSITLGAGCILDTVNATLREVGLQLPIQLGSSGSCQIGGLVAANAGGVNALKYGVVRDLVLGLEVVLPDGRVWNGLRKLRKDNSGYNLKHWFIGSEGTLGIITAASMKIVPRPVRLVTNLIALPSLEAAVSLFGRFQSAFHGRMEAFELMSRDQLLGVTAEMGLSAPMDLSANCYVLGELSSAQNTTALQEEAEAFLATCLEDGLISDAVVATSGAQAEQIWKLRHSVSEANVRMGPTIGSDTCVPISALPVFLERVGRELAGIMPDLRIHFIGHLGDGNIHVSAILDRARYAEAEPRAEAARRINAVIQRATYDCGGAISAEHGIGTAYVRDMATFRPALDLELMRAMKTSLDPAGLMNPGKVLPD